VVATPGELYVIFGYFLAELQLETSSDALWSAFLMLLAFRHDRGTKPGAEIVWQFVQLRVAINLDGLLGCVADDIAVVAPGKVVF